ncbi:FAD-dependent oxidoreductase [Actinomadura rudentiformis]|uniref:ferredoxin--NADP(+) reductase n=1 Tax=Actinomadura rudentiformis TaxID=359158 RepID=A0A6H9Z462_9ACTN|nr:FAD-dependent oxidoreductase [Actinomadura rudentiformis]KAB2349591.1 NAD(P)-binding protein [Actinomadura rudentiformis]
MAPMAAPLQVAVIGSGPAGLYAAEALVKQTDGEVKVDVFDRLPTPYGLVRYGVAPDHKSIKSIARYLQRVLETADVRFFGCVELGRDVTRTDLLDCYDAVIYSTGAMVDRHLGIPGEDLPGSVAATDFVNWYCGHPDAADHAFDLSVEEVAVIGVGNVAVDVVRILAKTADELRETDVPEHVLEALSKSRVRRIHMIGRRGPAQAKFTTKEARELGDLPNAEIHVRPEDMELDPASAEVAENDRHVRGNIKVLNGWTGEPAGDRPRRIDVRFWLAPKEITGTGRVEALRLERTRLDETGRVAGTGEYETLPVGMVLRSVGYQSVALEGVPFDERSYVVPNEGGRIIGPDGAQIPREYVAGWIKRGPTGVVGTNKADAAETVRHLLADLSGREEPPAHKIEELLESRGLPIVTYADWLNLDAAEIELARSLARGERVKLAHWEAMRKACHPS